MSGAYASQPQFRPASPSPGTSTTSSPAWCKRSSPPAAEKTSPNCGKEARHHDHAVARELESAPQEGEQRPSRDLPPADTNRREPDAHSLDATQGQQLGPRPNDDPRNADRFSELMTDERTVDRLMAHLRTHVAELRRLERAGAT